MIESPDAGPPRGSGDGGIGAAPIGESLDRVLRSLGRGGAGPTGGGSPSGMVALAGRWEEAVGAALSARCRPAELTGDGVLVVVVDDPAFIPELRFSGSVIADGANRVLGRAAVVRVEVRRRR